MVHDKFEDKNRVTFSPGGTLKRDINESLEPVRVTFNTNGEVERSNSPITSPKKKKEKFVCLSSHKEEHRVTGMLRAVRGEAKKSIIRKKVHDNPEVNKVSGTIKEAEKEEKGEKKKRLARVRNLINASRRLSEGVTTEEVTRNKTDKQDHEYEKRSRKESVSTLMHHLHHHEIKKDEEKIKVVKGKIAKEWFGMSEKVILRNLKDLPSCYIPLITTAVSLGNGFVRILEFIESGEDCKLISEDYSTHRIGEIVDTFCYEDGEKIITGPGKPYLAIYKYKKGKKIIVKGLKTVEEVKDVLTLLLKGGSGCLQKFCGKGERPEFVRCFMERKFLGGGRWKTEIKGVKFISKMPYLSGVNCCLDLVGVGGEGFECFELEGEVLEGLKGEMRIVGRQVERGWGGWRLERWGADWVEDEEGEWNLVNFLEVEGRKVEFKEVRGGRRGEKLLMRVS